MGAPAHQLARLRAVYLLLAPVILSRLLGCSVAPALALAALATAVPAVRRHAMAAINFLPSLVLTPAKEWLAGRRWWSRVGGRVLLGGILYRSSYTRRLLAEERVGAVVAVVMWYELLVCSYQPEDWAAMGVAFLHLPVTDFVAPSLATLRRGVAWMEEFLGSQEGAVYVHCKAGKGRSATLVTAFIMEQERCGVEEAVGRVEAARPGVSNLRVGARREVLDLYYQDMVARGVV